MRKTVWLLLLVLLSGCVKSNENQSNIDLIVDNGNPDIVIIGSELEGAYLAHSAKKEGLNVIILDPREKVGGQLLQGEMLFLDEPTDDQSKSLLQGNVENLFNRFKKGDIRKTEEFQTYYHELISGVPIESGIEIVDILVEQNVNERKAVKKLTYKNKSGDVKTIEAKYWVENTDFAYLSSKLSTDKIPGVETIFKVAEKDYMASSLMMKFKGVDWVKFKESVNSLDASLKESKYGATTTVTDTFTWGFGEVGRRYSSSREDIFLRGLNILNQQNGETLINALLIYDVDPSNPERVQEAITLGKLETDRVLPHLQKELPGWENAEINGYPEYLYIRDYDRFETEYVLSATDLLSGKMFWDNVGIGGYPLDIQGIKQSPWGVGLGKPDKYGMPLRSFMLKDFSNIVVSGKNVGASAAAYGSARIQANTSLAAEVIGIILGRIDGKKQLVDITEEEMLELHAYIKDEYKIDLKGENSINKLTTYTEEELTQINNGQLVVK